jgi:hypothetical protein
MQSRTGSKRGSEAFVGTLMTTCPVTGRDVEVGVETDKRTLAVVSEFSTRIICSGCGEEHTIARQDTWVCETIGGHREYSPEA